MTMPDGTCATTLAPSPWLHGPEAAPVTDPARLAEIARLRLDEMCGDEETRALLARLAMRFDLPSALVTLVLDGVQTYVATHGLAGWPTEAGGVPVEWSLCRFPVATVAPFVVEDAQRDALVRDNPLVRNEGLRCYAGVPLVTSTGAAVGALCVTGPRPRRFTEAEIAHLERLAPVVMARLERRAGRQEPPPCPA